MAFPPSPFHNMTCEMPVGHRSAPPRPRATRTAARVCTVRARRAPHARRGMGSCLILSNAMRIGLLILTALLALWIAVDLFGPAHGNLRDFDPQPVARLDTGMW